MPILTGGQTVFTICELRAEVIARLENRTQDLDRATVWLRDALLEITMDPSLRNEFDELELLGPTLVLTGSTTNAAAVQSYPFSLLIPTGDYNVNTLDVLLWTNPPLNSNRIRLIETSYQDTDRISPYPGQPVKWARFNDDIIFTPPPNLNYTVQARIYRQHPVDEDGCETEILIGRDWIEVLIWAAVMRGFMELLEYEKAEKVRGLLYGDPKYPDRPGIIEGKKKRHEKEAWRRQLGLRPILRKY